MNNEYFCSLILEKLHNQDIQRHSHWTLPRKSTIFINEQPHGTTFLAKEKQSAIFKLSPLDNRRLASLCGQFDENIRLIESELGVEIFNRGHHFQIMGNQAKVKAASDVLNNLYEETKHDKPITQAKVHLYIKQSMSFQGKNDKNAHFYNDIQLTKKHVPIKPRSKNQELYVKKIEAHDINFAIGPAGTGKTYLAVACAVKALENEEVNRLVLVRPAVEAGERLGFLPGTYEQKVDPYLRPLYDALYEMLGFEKVAKLIEHHVIEVAPLAYMRGRTLNDAFIILDESQNTTKEQMKMFLTRIGFGSKAVVTGDVTQIDLPKDQQSGLNHAIEVLKEVDSISMVFFQAKDVIRHKIVQTIVEAYDKYERKK